MVAQPRGAPGALNVYLRCEPVAGELTADDYDGIGCPLPADRNPGSVGLLNGRLVFVDYDPVVVGLPGVPPVRIPADERIGVAEATIPGVCCHCVVRPGDTLVLALADHVSPDQVARLKQQAMERLPGVDVAVAAGVSQMAVYRPGSSQGE